MADDARAVFVETFLAMTLGDESRIRIHGKKTLGDLCEQGTALIEVLHDHIDREERVLAIEHQFKLGVRLSNGEVRDVVGVLDLVVEEPDGQVAVVDVKTRSRGFAGMNTDHELQPSLYLALAGAAEFGATRFRYDGVVKKSRRPSFEQRYVERDATSLDVVGRLIEAAERGLKAGVYLPSPGPLCNYCPYQGRCRDEWGQQTRQRLAIASAA